MSKRRNSPADNFFEELVKIASLTPWWVTLPLALALFYFVPYGAPSDIQLQEPSDATSVILILFFSAFFKYFVPMGLVFGAILSISTSLKSDSLFKSIKTKGAHETVNELSWQDFEFLLSEWFKKQGFNTDLTGGGGADGGVDIRLHKQNELYLVQCKHYKAWKVSVQVVRELFGVMTAENAVGGYVVTSGKFTKEAVLFADGKNIVLIDGRKLESILETESPAVNQSNEDRCPKCGSELVERSGKFGKFNGCSAYPKCRYTKAI
jgi:restriction system protein